MSNPNYDPDRDRAGLTVAENALKRWKDMPPVQVTIPRWDAYVLVGILQFATRHLDGAMRGIGENFARHVQEGIADEPEIYQVMEQGWNPALDVQQAPPLRMSGEHLASALQRQAEIIGRALHEAESRGESVPRSGDPDWEEWERHALRAAGETYIIRGGKKMPFDRGADPRDAECIPEMIDGALYGCGACPACRRYVDEIGEQQGREYPPGIVL